MDVSFVIPLYNQLELTRRCLETLQATTRDVDCEIVLVDDGSANGMRVFLESLQGERFKVRLNDRNRGYAHAINRGASLAEGETLLLLNSDLEFEPGWLEPMLEGLKRPGVGAVGNVQVDPAAGAIDHSGYLVGWDGSLAHKRSPNRGLFGTPRYSRFHLVTGACLAIRRELFLRLGGLDENFFNSGEDIDLCLRLEAVGQRVLVANRSVVRHHVSASRGPASLNEERNARLLQARWSGRLAALAAYRWPDRYLSLFARDWRHFEPALAWQALPRWLGLKSGPAPAGLAIAKSRLARNERHWLSIIDGLTDHAIAEKMRKKHLRWMKDKFAYEGVFLDQEKPDGVWIREEATFRIPRGLVVSSVALEGALAAADGAETGGPLGLKLVVNGVETEIFHPIAEGPFSVEMENPPIEPERDNELKVRLLGVGKTNAYAFLGRVLRSWPVVPGALKRRLAAYRPQRKNRRLSLQRLRLNREDVLDFKKNPTSPLIFEYARKTSNLGVNLVGWYKAQLGVGESVRLAAKALDASTIEHCLVPLKVNCLASQGDATYDHRLVDDNPYPINVFHIDAPQCGDIDHHHGEAFRKERRNIAYWAWELPEFPDAWIRYFQYFDEIWCPSRFVQAAISTKSPVPVVSIPHCIDFAEPAGDYREKLGLPKNAFLFCFVYDLNSYQERKNPQAVIRAFKEAFLGTDLARDVGLVIKTQSADRNPEEFASMKRLLEGIPVFRVLDRTLDREDVYGLIGACDAYVSLHRSEGFGLTLAESMRLGKPVVATDWSATAEFVTRDNACPVPYELVELQCAYGPYQKGQYWAEPSVTEAARFMRRLVTDSAHARRLGENARRDIRAWFSPERVANLYEQRLKAIALW